MSNTDHLSLAANKKVLAMLAKHGSPSEKVVFSDFVIKINKRGKEQTRTILVTDMAVYNLIPDKYNKVKRRVDIESITAISISTMSDEFVMHIPEEYDYRYKSSKQCEVVECIKNQKKDGILNINNVKKATLEGLALTKKAARQQSREDILKRLKELAAENHESDDEDRKEVATGKDGCTSMLSNNSKVRLSDFDLLKVIGRGAYGKVMQVKKKSDGKIYAMKILKKGAVVAQNQVEHTKAERSILQQLQHPFLMTLRYAFQSKDKLYLVLDYLRGGELFFHLKNQRRFTEDVCRLWIGEIALAFGHLHSLGVIYRDLKPENVLLDDHGHVCLTDFGLAKEVKDGEKSQTWCGTAEYMAPEIVMGHGHDKAVDWWTLGALLYELLIGIPPFFSQNVQEVYEKITRTGVLKFPPPPFRLSQNCIQFIVELLNRDPAKRLGSINDIEDIKQHKWFTEAEAAGKWDWDMVYNKKIDSLYIPNISGNDPTNFDEEFLSEPVVDSVATGSAIDSATADFQGFTFQPGAAIPK